MLAGVLHGGRIAGGLVRKSGWFGRLDLGRKVFEFGRNTEIKAGGIIVVDLADAAKVDLKPAMTPGFQHHLASLIANNKHDALRIAEVSDDDLDAVEQRVRESLHSPRDPLLLIDAEKGKGTLVPATAVRFVPHSSSLTTILEFLK